MATSAERSKTPPIPSGTRPLQHQVAGHVFGRSNGHTGDKIGQSDAFCPFSNCNN